jgi:hypothetical protein
MTRSSAAASLVALLLGLVPPVPAQKAAPPLAYREIEGRAESFTFVRQWASYYWREDFTLLVRDDKGQLHRVISREPTPWTDLRLGTTYTGLKVDWKVKPRVRVIGVRGIDRTPAKFPGLDLDAEKTITAFILRAQVGKAGDKSTWRDFYVNNWFHKWGPDVDRKVLAHYANTSPHYTVYGYLGGIAAPFDDAGKKLLAKYQPLYTGIIYHGRVVKAEGPIGYEVRVLHLMGRHKKTLNYEVFHGSPKELTKLDSRPPKPR